MRDHGTNLTGVAMRTRWRVSCAALILSVPACAGKSAADRIAEHERVRVSWEETAHFVGAEWGDRAIPDAYAMRTLARASTELRSESTALEKDAIPEATRARLHASLNVALARMDTLERAVRAGDRGAVARVAKHAPRANADSLLREAALR
jgi:hypothetical protein